MEATKEYPIDRFLQQVSQAAAKDDRGYLACLRRGLSKGQEMRSWEYLIPYCERFEDPALRAVWCTIGGLAAILFKEHLVTDERWNNLGTTMRALATESGESEENKALKSFEPKFRRLLECDDTISLCEIVVRIGRAAAVKGVKVNLRGLFWDLWNWSEERKRDKIRLEWAKQYFRVYTPAEGGEGV